MIIAADAVDDYDPGLGRHGLSTLLLHETLHVLSLGHVDDAGSVMTSRISDGAGELGPGDVAGHGALARRSCGAYTVA